jgi:hypothetical protein
VRAMSQEDGTYPSQISIIIKADGHWTSRLQSGSSGGVERLFS